MRTASQAFYLAIFTLWGTSHAQHHSVNSDAASGPDVCAIEPKAIVSDACASFSTLDSLNADLTPHLHAITKTTDFFAYYRLNLFNRVCAFWSDANSMCGNIACAVNTLDNENEIPEIWRAEELSKLEGPKAGHPGRRQQQERQERPLQGQLGEGVGESCVVEYDDECDERDYCVPEDESSTAKGDYVSLVDNPERFTGYAGPGPRQVWDAIYRENCFTNEWRPSAANVLQASPFGGQASNDLRNVMQKYERQQAFSKNALHGMSEDLSVGDDECLEKRVFHRIISGMHASISTHICWDYLNQTTGVWGPNLQCYEERLHAHPERISNLYFNYALVLRSLAKLQGQLHGYAFCLGDPAQDRATKQKVLSLVDRVAAGPEIFDESLMFRDAAATGLKEDFRNRFRNVSRLMDCVGCDKCRLWGKLQTVGYGTALKVLFEYDEDTRQDQEAHLRRTELVALVNTLDRISHSLTALSNFRKMIAAKREAEAADRTGERASVREPLTGSIRRVPSNPSPSQADEDEFDDFDDAHPPPPPPPVSISDIFWAEWYRTWKAFRFVITSWINLPQTLWHIFLNEAARVWEYWLGLPISPRAWEIRFPDMDEL
ncbi:MAG: endoplasmic oxidoreductin-1 [Caeruleum heppii]|nr:MAG: endoplasmic oxidoreductin-1 [Caeruleum heppii]